MVDTLEAIDKKMDWIVGDNDAVKELLGYEVIPNESHYESGYRVCRHLPNTKEDMESLDVMH